MTNGSNIPRNDADASSDLGVKRGVTLQELHEHDGEHGSRLWVAVDGLVYDVTDCAKWRTGMHEQMHFPGLELSSELPDAPHGHEVFLRPCVRLMGHLVSRSTD
jgi:predicted heme/steroid binding protein